MYVCVCVCANVTHMYLFVRSVMHITTHTHTAVSVLYFIRVRSENNVPHAGNTHAMRPFAYHHQPT